MAILKVRGLGTLGVIADVDPYELPVGAFSFAVNARFVNGKVERAPVWRKASELGTVDPRFVFSRTATADDIFIGYKNGRVYKWANGAETNYTLSGYANSSAEATWTECSLGGVTYVNRSDRAPWALLPSDSAFTDVTGWDATWRARILRAYNGSVCAFNVTKSGVSLPTLVKTSDIVDDPGVLPADWDHTDPTNNATENTLTELKGEIVDAGVLGDDMVIYGTSQNFVMRADGSDAVYAYKRLPFDGGAINTNCHVEVEGKHFVFGPTTIYAHDGLSKVDVISGKNREHVYGSMNASKASKFFVLYNPNSHTIAFHYVGADTFTAFTGGSGCNRVAVLQVATGIWSFDDAPLVHSAVVSGISVASPTWATLTGTWDTIGGTWQDFEDGFKKAPVYVGELSAEYDFDTALYVNDPYGTGSIVNAPVEVAANAPMYLERDGIDLDEVNVELRGEKHIVSVFPQGRLEAGADPMEFSFGSASNFGETPAYSDWQTYDPRTEPKLDYDMGGRWFSMRCRYTDYKTVSLSGIDLDVEILGDGP